MRSPTSRLPAAAPLAAAGGYRLPSFIGRLRQTVRDWLIKRATLAELHGLDERTLADLRIYPGDFQGIANGTYIREAAHDVALKPADGGKSRRTVRPYY